MYLVMPKGVMSLEGHTGIGIVIGTKGDTGVDALPMALGAAIPVAAKKGFLDIALGAEVELGRWLRRRRRALAVAAPRLEPFHP